MHSQCHGEQHKKGPDACLDGSARTSRASLEEVSSPTPGFGQGMYAEAKVELEASHWPGGAACKDRFLWLEFKPKSENPAGLFATLNRRKCRFHN